MSTATTSEPFVDSETVQHHLGGISPRTLGNYRKRGLPYIEVSPRVFRYRLSEVTRWMESRLVIQRSA